MALGLVAVIDPWEFLEIASLVEDLVESAPPTLRSIVAGEFIEVASLLGRPRRISSFGFTLVADQLVRPPTSRRQAITDIRS